MDAQETRRLLELAAKAVGIEALGYEQTLGVRYVNGSEDSPFIDFWKPHLDDGDSRRLEVSLEMNVYINDRYCIAEIFSDGDEPPVHKKEYCNCSTKAAAVRRAVLRAAAAIGEAMQERGAA